MWRWIIRAYVSFVVFVFLLFCSGAVLIRVAHLFVWAGEHEFLQWVHSHILFTMFLLGIVAGQAVLGSNFTGRGWFRSKSGLTYEGFKLEEIKPWTWLLVSPIFLLGIVAWVLERSESGVLSNLTLENFYHEVLMPNCTFAWWKHPRLYPFCGVQLLFVGIWMASLGYSLAPLARRRSAHFLRRLRNAPEAVIPVSDDLESSMKEKAEL